MNRGVAYVKSAFSLKCFPDVAWAFQSAGDRAAKEWTESLSMWRAAISELALNPRADNIDCYVVGDGCRPRTGLLISHLSKWNVISIDPMFRMEQWLEFRAERLRTGNDVQRLTLFKAKVEDIQMTYVVVDGKEVSLTGRTALLVLPHSHAKLDHCLELVKNYETIHVINMPCCTPVPERYLSKEAVKQFNVTTYIDEDCWSPKRTVHVWRNLKKVS